MSLWDNWGDERDCDEGHWHVHTRGLPWGLTEVVGMVQEVHYSQRRLLRRELEFHVCTINKSAHTKKSLETYWMILISLLLLCFKSIFCKTKVFFYPTKNLILRETSYFLFCFKHIVFLPLFSDFEKIYQCLNINVIDRGESFYQDKMVKLVAELEISGW